MFWNPFLPICMLIVLALQDSRTQQNMMLWCPVNRRFTDSSMTGILFTAQMTIQHTRVNSVEGVPGVIHSVCRSIFVTHVPLQTKKAFLSLNMQINAAYTLYTSFLRVVKMNVVLYKSPENNTGVTVLLKSPWVTKVGFPTNDCDDIRVQKWELTRLYIILYTAQVFRQEIQPGKDSIQWNDEIGPATLRIHQCGVKSVQLDHFNWRLGWLLTWKRIIDIFSL